jgi:hypothetical protein
MKGTNFRSIQNKKLCHGIYILKGGGMGGDLDIDTTSIDPVTLQQCDGQVFIFNTTSNYPSSGGTCTGAVVSGNHDITLNAMTTGTYAGMLFYQDSSCTAALSWGGTSFALTSTGTIYLPNAAFTAGYVRMPCGNGEQQNNHDGGAGPHSVDCTGMEASEELDVAGKSSTTRWKSLEKRKDRRRGRTGGGG